jgi:hypothetical protein
MMMGVLTPATQMLGDMGVLGIAGVLAVAGAAAETGARVIVPHSGWDGEEGGLGGAGG